MLTRAAVARPLSAQKKMRVHPDATFATALSTTEMRITMLLSSGLSNREIAQATFRTEATVKYHLNHIFQKLGATSRVQVALMAVAINGRLQPESAARKAATGK